MTRRALWRVRGAREGFTLLEVVVVITIMGVVMAIAVPAFRAAQRAARVNNGAQQLIGDLRLARTEAIRRNASVFVARTGLSTYEIEHIGERTLMDGVMFQAGPDTVRFSAFGPVLLGSGTYTLRAGGQSVDVRVSASGHAQAQ